MTSRNSNMNTPLKLFSEGLYTLTNLSPGFLMLSQTAFMKAFSTVFESVTMTGKKKCGENMQKIKKVVIELLPSGMFASTGSWPIAFTLWKASHKVSRRQVQKKKRW